MNIIGLNGDSLCSFYKRNDVSNRSTEDITDDEAFFTKSSPMDHLNFDSPVDSNHEDEDYMFATKRPKRFVKPKLDYIISDIEHKNLRKAFKESILEVRRNKSNERNSNLCDQISSSIDDFEDNSMISDEKIKLCLKQAARKFASNFSIPSSSPSTNLKRKKFKFKKKHSCDTFNCIDVPVLKKRKYVDTTNFIKYLILRGTDVNPTYLDHSKMIYNSSVCKPSNKQLTIIGDISSCSNDSYDYDIPKKSHNSFTTSIDSSELTELSKSETSLTNLRKVFDNIEEPMDYKSVDYSNTFPQSELLSNLQMQNQSVNNASKNSILTENGSFTTINSQSVDNLSLKLMPSLIPINNNKILKVESKLLNNLTRLLPKKQKYYAKLPLPRISPKITKSTFEFKNLITQPSVISNYHTLTMPLNFMYLVPVGSLSTSGVSLPLPQHLTHPTTMQFNNQVSSTCSQFNSSNTNKIDLRPAKLNLNHPTFSSPIPVACTINRVENSVNIDTCYFNPKVKVTTHLNAHIHHIQPKENDVLVGTLSTGNDLSINSSQNIDLHILDSHNKKVLNVSSSEVDISNNSSQTSRLTPHYNEDHFKLKKANTNDTQDIDSHKLFKKVNGGQSKIINEESLNSPPKNLDSEIHEAKVFYPTEIEFKNIFKYIHSIFIKDPHIGICKIIPPKEWKINCNISDELKIPLHNQHIHKLRNRFCKTNMQLSEIRAHIESEGGSIKDSPQISGVEIDLPHLMECVESLGGLENVVLHNKWSTVISMMRLPPSSNERVNKIYDVYCQYLLSYNGLTQIDKEKLRKELFRNKKKINIECLLQTQCKFLVHYYRISQKIFSSHFKKSKPTIKMIEEEYNNIINNGNHHVVIQKAIYKPPYNVNKSSKMQSLEKAIHINGEISSYLDKISDIFLSKINIGMLFSTDCWRRDSLYMANIHYMHTDSNAIWYSIDKSNEDLFKKVLVKLTPDLVHNNLNNWLTENTLMMSAEELVANKLNVHRVVQNCGEIIVTFPGTYFANVSCDYSIIECVRRIIDEDKWIVNAPLYFQMLEECCVPSDANYIEYLLAASCSKTKKKKVPTATLR